MNEIYISQFKLLLQVIPFISEKPEFALKGGTAINMKLSKRNCIIWKNKFKKIMKKSCCIFHLSVCG